MEPRSQSFKGRQFNYASKSNTSDSHKTGGKLTRTDSGWKGGKVLQMSPPKEFKVLHLCSESLLPSPASD